METDWVDLSEDHLPAVVELYRRCLAVDGGLPATAAPAFLGGRYTGEGVSALGLRDGAGTLIAAGSVRDRRGVATVTGQVDPAHRRQGLGAALLDRLLDAARSRAGRIAVETEALTAEADALLRSRGLRQAFAEDVFRRGLEAAFPEAPSSEAAGTQAVRTEEWNGGNQGDFFEAYRSAFAERPGFPGWTKEQWVDWTAADDEFRPQYSLLARALDGSPMAFVTCAQGFLIQIGTVPRWRGRGLGRELATAALARMRAAGVEDVFLDVNVNNPASAALFRSLASRRSRGGPATRKRPPSSGVRDTETSRDVPAAPGAGPPGASRITRRPAVPRRAAFPARATAAPGACGARVPAGRARARVRVRP